MYHSALKSNFQTKICGPSRQARTTQKNSGPAERDAAYSTPIAAQAALVFLRAGLREATDESNLETGRGRPARIVLGDPIPEIAKLLPQPGELGA